MPSEFQSYSKYPPHALISSSLDPPTLEPFALGIPKRWLCYGMDIFWNRPLSIISPTIHYALEELKWTNLPCNTSNFIEKCFASCSVISKERVLNNTFAWNTPSFWQIKVPSSDQSVLLLSYKSFKMVDLCLCMFFIEFLVICFLCSGFTDCCYFKLMWSSWRNSLTGSADMLQYLLSQS